MKYKDCDSQCYKCSFYKEKDSCPAWQEYWNNLKEDTDKKNKISDEIKAKALLHGAFHDRLLDILFYLREQIKDMDKAIEALKPYDGHVFYLYNIKDIIAESSGYCEEVGVTAEKFVKNNKAVSMVLNSFAVEEALYCDEDADSVVASVGYAVGDMSDDIKELFCKEK